METVTYLHYYIVLPPASGIDVMFTVSPVHLSDIEGLSDKNTDKEGINAQAFSFLILMDKLIC